MPEDYAVSDEILDTILKGLNVQEVDERLTGETKSCRMMTIDVDGTTYLVMCRKYPED